MTKPLRVFVIGLGQMGRSHALAYHENPGFEIVGLSNRSPVDLPPAIEGYPWLETFEAGLALLPDVVSINTYSDSHADLAVAALEAGAHVFVEKPLATSAEDARRVVAAAEAAGRKLVVGYILRHHPSWVIFIEKARELGPPYVMRMNLNQQSSGKAWEIHKQLLQSTSPVVDCGVHYLDVMCQITDARPVQVRGMGLRLSEEIAEDQVNYGHLQVLFEDGSLGWYEAGWGPMMSETAYFVKDVISPRGAVSILMENEDGSADVDSHTRTSKLRVHHAGTDGKGRFLRGDELLSMAEEPDHQALCNREQAFLLQAVREDLDLTDHMAQAVRSLEIVLAAEESRREGRAVAL